MKVLSECPECGSVRIKSSHIMGQFECAECGCVVYDIASHVPQYRVSCDDGQTIACKKSKEINIFLVLFFVVLIIMIAVVVMRFFVGTSMAYELSKEKFAMPTVTASHDREVLAPGATFRDCAGCPEMIVIPAGNFTMGWPIDYDRPKIFGGWFSLFAQIERIDRESPPHAVTITRSFAIGKYVITFDEWDACVANGGCKNYWPDDEGWGRGRRPVINVSWNDAQSYVSWISGVTKKHYRLPSEAEWEYAARANTTRRWTSYTSSALQEFYDSCRRCFNPKTELVDNKNPNLFGVNNAFGFVWQWVDDCWNRNYQGAPSNGAAWLDGQCNVRVLRGESWGHSRVLLRLADSNRDRVDIRWRDLDIGFRIVRTID